MNDQAGVLEIHTIKPLDEQAILQAARNRCPATVEEHSILGIRQGSGGMWYREYPVPLKRVGLADRLPRQVPCIIILITTACL
jgi:transketolase